MTAPARPSIRPLPLTVNEARRLVKALNRLQSVLWEVYQDAFWELDDLTAWADTPPDAHGQIDPDAPAQDGEHDS